MCSWNMCCSGFVDAEGMGKKVEEFPLLSTVLILCRSIPRNTMNLGES